MSSSYALILINDSTDINTKYPVFINIRWTRFTCFAPAKRNAESRKDDTVKKSAFRIFNATGFSKRKAFRRGTRRGKKRKLLSPRRRNKKLDYSGAGFPGALSTLRPPASSIPRSSVTNIKGDKFPLPRNNGDQTITVNWERLSHAVTRKDRFSFVIASFPRDH